MLLCLAGGGLVNRELPFPKRGEFLLNAKGGGGIIHKIYQTDFSIAKSMFTNHLDNVGMVLHIIMRHVI